MVDFIEKPHYGFEDLLRLVSFLRSEGGCPWDRVQTHQSIRRNFLEEAYEACEGLDRDDPKMMAEEFGDVLLQVVFHTDIERQRGTFTMDDVCDGICKKLVFRHPQLFGGEAEDWETLKKKEKGAKTVSDLMDGVARSLPALIRSEKLLEKAGGCGSVDAAVDEAAAQLRRFKGAQGSDAEHALGEVLLRVVDAAMEKGLDAESLLQDTCERWIARTRAAESESVVTPVKGI